MAIQGEFSYAFKFDKDNEDVVEEELYRIMNKGWIKEPLRKKESYIYPIQVLKVMGLKKNKQYYVKINVRCRTQDKQTKELVTNKTKEFKVIRWNSSKPCFRAFQLSAVLLHRN